MLGSTSHSNGFPLTGSSATQSSSTLGGSTSTVAAAGSPFFGVGSSLFSHGPHFMVSTSGSTVFGQGTISNEHRGSRIAPYATTTEVEGASSEQPTGKLTSVSAIPIYGDKNHEELRWEDYQLGDKGGSNPYNTPNFGSGGPCTASTVSAVGSSSIPGFESSSRPPFEASSTRAFTFGSTSLFGQPTSKFDVNAVGTTFPYGTQISLFGPQITASPFGCVGFGKLASSDQSGGSRIAAYAATVEVEGTNSEQPAGKLMSISVISTYRNKSHEELRWEDYQLGDKGGSSPSCMPNFGSAGPYGASSVSAFGSSSMLACGPSSTPTFRFGPIPSYGLSSNAFVGSSGGTNPSSYGTGHSDFGSRTVESTFGSTGFVNPAFNDQHGGSRIMSYTATIEVDELICNQSVAKFQSISAIPIYRNKSHEELRWEDYQLGDKGGPFPASQSVGMISFGASTTKSSLLGPPAFCLSAINPSSSSTSSNSPKMPAFAASVGPSLIPPCSSSTFSASYTTIPFWTVSSTSAIPSAFEASSHPKFETSTSPPLVGASSSSASRLSSSIISHASAPGTAPTFTSGLNYYSTQSSPWFLSEPLLGQTNATIGQTASTLGQGTAPSLGQSNISSGQNLFLSTPPLHPTSKECSLTSPHPEQAAQTDGNFNTNFGQTSAGVTNVLGQGTFDQLSTTQGAAVVPSQPLLPRENPRELIVGRTEQWPTRSEERLSLLKDPSTSVHNKENAGVSIVDKKQSSPFKPEDRTDGVDLDVDSTQKRDADTPFPGHKDDEARTRTAHDVELLMPKLHHTDYYTEPTIQELATKERGEAGFCCHVKDFLVGRHGYGCIKFSGETDVRGLELESLVQFNNREVILYMDESKKPPAGEGLNKEAEVTLFNIKCVDKRTGNQYMDGPRVNNYRNMLMKAAKNQGAEHVSYDPVKGEWKFRLQHFSKYLLSDEDEESGRK